MKTEGIGANKTPESEEIEFALSIEDLRKVVSELVEGKYRKEKGKRESDSLWENDRRELEKRTASLTEEDLQRYRGEAEVHVRERLVSLQRAEEEITRAESLDDLLRIVGIVFFDEIRRREIGLAEVTPEQKLEELRVRFGSPMVEADKATINALNRYLDAGDKKAEELYNREKEGSELHT